MSVAAHRIGQLLKGLAALGLGSYGAMAVSLAINALLTRRLGVEAFGRLSLLLMTSQVISLLVANWTQTGIVRFGAQEFAARQSVATAFWSRLWIVMPGGLLAGLALLAGRTRLSTYLGIPAWGLWLIAVHFLATLALTTLGAVFQARNEMPRYGASLFLDKALMVSLVLLLPAAWVREPLTVLAMYATSSLLVAIAGFIALGPRALLPPAFDRGHCLAMLTFSLPLILSSWAGLLGTSWFDLVVIKWYRPAAEVGLYALGTALAGVVQQVTIIFSTLLLPQLSVMVAKNERDRITFFVERVLPYWLLAMTALFTLVILNARWALPVVFGSSFQRSVVVLALLMPASSALSLFNAFSPLVSALGATWMLTAICLASGVVNVVMDLLLIPRFGIEGAAVATVAAYAVSAALTLILVQARLRLAIVRLAWLALPVAAVCVCFLLLEGLTFYAAAVPAAAVTLVWLTRSFRLFRVEDMAFLGSLRVALRPQSTVPLR